MEQRRQNKRDLRTCHSIYRFPDFLLGMEEGIRQPKLASFGPYYKGTEDLLPFEEHKTDFLDKFLERIGKGSLDKLVNQLLLLEESIRGCYSEDTKSMSSKDFAQMMAIDGSFIVELLHQHVEGLVGTWPWNLNTLISDLLKMGNQLPFFVLENLHLWTCKTGDKSSIALRRVALRFFNQALGRPLDVDFQNGQQPKHLLDLVRRSLHPRTPSQNNCKAFPESIQRAEILCNGGITLRRNKATSLLEIDFRKLQIPPFALKIPPVAIDDLTTTILMNCVALEQCMHNTSKHFTAYIRFMNCLLREVEDVRFLRTANIITPIQAKDEDVITLLESVRGKVRFNARDCYLWKQYQEIDSYYDSFGAYIWRNFARHNVLTVVVPILAAIITLFGWLIPWLFPKKGTFQTPK